MCMYSTALSIFLICLIFPQIVDHLYGQSVTQNSIMCLITSLADGTEVDTIDVALTFDVFADTQGEVTDLVSVIMEADFDQINTVTDSETSTNYTLNSFQTTG